MPQATSQAPQATSQVPQATFQTPAWPLLTCFFLHASREDWAKRAVTKKILLLTFHAISRLSFSRFCSFFDEMITTSIFLTSGANCIFLSVIFQKWECNKDCSLKCKITTTYDFSQSCLFSQFRNISVHEFYLLYCCVTDEYINAILCLFNIFQFVLWWKRGYILLADAQKKVAGWGHSNYEYLPHIFRDQKN